MPPTPKKRGRRRLTALEVLQAKSAFCRSQRIFLRLACSWERFEGSAEATKGAPVPPIGGLTVLRIPSKKGKAGMLLGGLEGEQGGIDGWVAWGGGWGVVLESSAGATTTHYASFLTLGGVGDGPGRRAGGEGEMGGGPD